MAYNDYRHDMHELDDNRHDQLHDYEHHEHNIQTTDSIPTTDNMLTTGAIQITDD